MILSKFIGDKAFYKKVMLLAVPIMIQNGITNLVNMVDNIMVGRVGTEAMSGVAIVNQILFVVNLCIFGTVAGIGIFTAQYFGKDDNDGIRHTFRLKLLSTAVIGFGAIVILYAAGDILVEAFLHEGSEDVNLVLAFNEAKRYLSVMAMGLIPFALTQTYASTLRETEKPVIPMVSGIIAVFVNLCLNYLLIFGKLGFPQLGVQGAAIATVISRVVECLVVVIFTHSAKKKNPFIVGAYNTLKVPVNIVKLVMPKAVPLLVNETLWSVGMALLTRCYSLRGLAVVAASNICSTITNVFIVALIAFGDAIAIIVGGLLGAGEIEKAKDTDTKLSAFSFMVCLGLGVVMAVTSSLYPKVYNTTDEARALAEMFIICHAVYLPLNSIIHSCYFTLRSGGKTLITFLFDSVYMICVVVLFTYVLARFTNIPIVAVYALSLAIEIPKAVLGIILVKKGTWIQNLVADSSEKEST